MTMKAPPSTAPYGLMADLHLHNWASFSATDAAGVNTRLTALLGEIRRCALETQKAGGKYVVMAGDVFHVRGSIAPSVLNPTADALHAINKELGTEFIIIPGNHDLEGRDTTRIGSAVTALESADHVRVVNEVTYLDEIDAYVFPWFERTDALLEHLEHFRPEEGEYEFDAIIHAPIDGVISGLPGHGLTPEILRALGYGRVFAGHYHHHKDFGGVISIGALAHHTWSDVGSKAGFLVVYPGAKQHRWFQSHLPQFIDLSKLAAVEPDEIPLMVDGHYVRMRVEASKVKEVEAARTELLSFGAAAVLIQAEPKPPADEARTTSELIKTGASLEASVTEFVHGMKHLDDPSAVAAEAMSVLGTVVATH